MRLDPIATQTIRHYGERRFTPTERDAVGRIAAVEVREGEFDNTFISRTEYGRNLVGWADFIREATDTNFSTDDTTLFTYNSRGQQIRIEDASGQTTRMEYTAFGEINTRILPHNQTGFNEMWTYDGHGRPSMHRLADGNEIVSEYDSRGDLVMQRWANLGGFPNPNTVLSEWSYDKRGRVIASTDYNIARTLIGQNAIEVNRTWTYDALDRVLSETMQAGATSNVFTTSSVWTPTAAGWQREVTYPSGKVVTRQLDTVGRTAAFDIEGRTVSFDWMGKLYRGRTHDCLVSRTSIRCDS